MAHYSESDLKLLRLRSDAIGARSAWHRTPDDRGDPRQRDPLLAGVVIPDELVDMLMDYMSALTDKAARELAKSVPKTVPSGLKIDRP